VRHDRWDDAGVRLYQLEEDAKPARRSPRGTRRAPVPTEAQEQRALIQWAAQGAPAAMRRDLELLHAVPNAGGFTGGFRRNGRRVVGGMAQGVKAGVPDLFLPVPRGGANGLYIEMKRRRDYRVSEEQAQWLNRLARLGYACAVACGAEAAQEAVQDYLKTGTLRGVPAEL
jgi:hypothetical protein